MNRKEAKQMLPIIKAFAEGKTIEFYVDGIWQELNEPSFDLDANLYRIKSELKYRPFRTQEECWNEMHKHPDFGWVRKNLTGELCQISRIFLSTDDLNISLTHNNTIEYSSYQMVHSYKFIDGEPFGIKE